MSDQQLRGGVINDLYVHLWDVKSTLALLWTIVVCYREIHHENGHAERLLYRLQSSDAEEEIKVLIRGQRLTKKKR